MEVKKSVLTIFEERGKGGRLKEDKRTVLTMSLRTDVRMGGCGGQEVCTHYVYEGGLVGCEIG